MHGVSDQGETRDHSLADGQGGCQLQWPNSCGPCGRTSSGLSFFLPNCMTGAVRMGAARTAAAERANCAGANASTEQRRASMNVESILDEAGILQSARFRFGFRK